MGSIDLDDFMKYNDLSNLDGNQYGFGSHTINHTILSHLPEEVAENGILRGHKAVEARLKRKVNYFAYPFGNYRHWSHQNEIALIRIPYIIALTANGGVNHYYYPFHVRRIGLLNERKDDLRRIFMKQAVLIV